MAEPGLPSIRVVAGSEELAEAAAELVIENLGRALSRRGRARWVLAGGSTPLAAYRLLAAGGQAVDWSRVDFFWGDERCVPPGAAESNYRAACDALLDPLGIEQSRRFRLRGEVPAEQVAGEYDSLVGSTLAAGPWDLVLLGLGSDGHTASLFPPRLQPAQGNEWVVPTQAPEPPSQRVSMTLKALQQARRVVILVGGAAKASALARVWSGDPTLHASALRDSAVWCVDQAAARLIRQGTLPTAVHWTSETSC